jgi:hypothetical protein
MLIRGRAIDFPAINKPSILVRGGGNMEKRKYIVLLAAMLLVIGAPSLLFAGGGKPLATDESFKIGQQNCQLNVGFDQLRDDIMYFSATPAGSTEKGDICFCDEEGGCFSCGGYGGGGFASLALAKPASGAPDWCNTNNIKVSRLDWGQNYICEKKVCKPNKKGNYDCTEAIANFKCERRDSVHRRTAESLGDPQVCVNDRLGTRICLGTP